MKVTKSKKLMFSVAVAFVSVFFFAYAIAAFYPAPQYEDYCSNDLGMKYSNDSVDCVNGGGKWIDYQGDRGPFGGYCDFYVECNDNYQSDRKPYERNVFFVNIILGIVLFVFAFFLGLEAVSSGLMGGAIMLIVYGCIRYWVELSDIWRTMILGFALVLLIVLGYKKLRD